MIRILIIRTYPSILDPDGYNIQETGLAKALIRAGAVCDVVLYNGNNADEIREIKVPGTENGVVKVYMRHGKGILKNGFFPGLKKITEEYDILQVNEYDQITSWLYYTYSKKPVVIYHGPYYDGFNKGYNFKCKVFDNTFLRICKHKDILCLTKSKASAAFLKQKGFDDTIPIGVGLDTDNFSKDADKQTAKIDEIWDLKKWNIIYVGKIEPRRNPYLLLEIADKLKDIDDNIRLTIIGSGEKEYLKEWKESADRYIKDGVLTYIERMSQTDLRDVYSKAKLMIFPSNYEIFGMVLLEAMYFDLPVISSDNGGSDTLISDGSNGMIVKEFDKDAWLNAIKNIYRDKERYDNIKNNLMNTDHSVYTWDGIAAKYLLNLKEHGLINE